MSKTLLRHPLIKNIFDIFVDFHIFIHFHYMKIWVITKLLLQRESKKTIVYYRLCRDGIYFDKISVSEYKLFKRSNKANLFIALVQ